MGRVLFIIVLAVCVADAAPLGTGFTYQGELEFNAAPANGEFDFQFELFDAETLGASMATPVSLEDVAVSEGVFSVELDFGDGPFAGDQLWLEIGVRPGADAGGFQGLAPRQKVSATPYALHAEMVAMNSIGSAEISNNSITAADLGADSVRASELADNAVASANLLDETITAADLAPNSVGASELANNSVGSGEIINGSISSADLGNGSVGSSQLAVGAVRAANIDSTQVQIRIQGTCSLGEMLAGVNADGSVACNPLPAVPTSRIQVDDPANAVGLDTSIAIGTDGLPVISYRDATANTVKLAKCNDGACGNATIATLDIAADLMGSRTSIAIGSDGLPLIAYYLPTTELAIVKCNDAACSARDFATVDASANNVGAYASMAVDSGGLPVISYWDGTALSLKVARCNDPACSGAATITTVDDPTNSVGTHTAIAIGTDGWPVISYHDFTAKSLKVAKCNDPACTGGGETITTVDDPGNSNSVGEYTSIAIDASGLPVISYMDITAGTLKVAKCNDPACAGGGEMISTVDDPVNFVGEFTAIAIAADGLPVISYHDGVAASLKITKCNDAACSGGDETVTTVDDDPTFGVGFYTAIAIGADGLPVISYQGQSASLKVAKCGSPACR